IEQAGRPVDLYENPDNLFVAGFIGSPKMNFVTARVTALTGKKATLAAGALGPHAVEAGVRGAASVNGAEGTLGGRPEHARTGEGQGIRGLVKVVEQLGNGSYLYVEAEGGAAITLEQRRLTAIRPGETVLFAPEPEHVFLFDKSGLRV